MASHPASQFDEQPRPQKIAASGEEARLEQDPNNSLENVSARMRKSTVLSTICSPKALIDMVAFLKKRVENEERSV
jgi:hypothetical protein